MDLSCISTLNENELKSRQTLDLELAHKELKELKQTKDLPDLKELQDLKELKELKELTSSLDPSIKRYFDRRHELWSNFDNGIIMDTQGWYSVTPENIANHVADHAFKALTASIASSKTTSASSTTLEPSTRTNDAKIVSSVFNHTLVIDAFAGMGGNTIAFARKFKHVVAIEIDKTRLECCRHNSRIYNVENKIEFIHGDFTLLAQQLKQKAQAYKHVLVFLSPPWGGPKYTNSTNFDISKMIVPNGIELYKLAQSISPNVIYCLPRNIDRTQVEDLLFVDRPITLSGQSNIDNGQTGQNGETSEPSRWSNVDHQGRPTAFGNWRKSDPDFKISRSSTSSVLKYTSHRDIEKGFVNTITTVDCVVRNYQSDQNGQGTSALELRPQRVKQFGNKHQTNQSGQASQTGQTGQTIPNSTQPIWPIIRSTTQASSTLVRKYCEFEDAYTNGRILMVNVYFGNLVLFNASKSDAIVSKGHAFAFMKRSSPTPSACRYKRRFKSGSPMSISSISSDSSSSDESSPRSIE